VVELSQVFVRAISVERVKFIKNSSFGRVTVGIVVFFNFLADKIDVFLEPRILEFLAILDLSRSVLKRILDLLMPFVQARTRILLL
jgi:hypothetical protein